MEKLTAGFEFFICLFALSVALVASAVDKGPRQNARISFDNDPQWIALLHVGNCDTRAKQTRRSFEEHQCDRNTVKLLGAN
ncbi:hypothetical protein ISM_07615 [Roseovarius nubinhibens ISM]|uniref:Secreted protein n=1 Tax=Roseovarius nubinhibens (strain ATCC BAA-591 / DSM 15170 / ISM) TaxID=89187 RepID=A3SLB5_ROSNI|nr:hypothetical protein ISM_07615 [Roseovarius nubinhibens ISM]